MGKTSKSGDGMTYRCEYVRCSKVGCGGCPHGPYWYAYYRSHGKLKKKYVGKRGPEIRCEKKTVLPDARDDIFTKKSCSTKLAYQLLSLPDGSSREECLRSFRGLTMMYHPDRGGDEHEFKLINAAWSYLRSHYNWK